MRYRLIVVGKASRRFYEEAAAHYRSRLEKVASIETIEVKEGRGSDPEAARRREASALESASDGYRVALDERGTAWTSERLAEHVQDLETRGVSRISLWIGGADGIDPDLRSRSDERWRLSDLTLPHDLARIVVLEQLYRIETIRSGHPYHRS